MMGWGWLRGRATGWSSPFHDDEVVVDASTAGVVVTRDGVALIAGGGTVVWVDDEGRFDRKGGPAIVRGDGHTAWFRGGVLHRDGGPAVSNSGVVAWFQFGVPHRVGGPAFTWPDGESHWYRQGRLHRNGGPAIEGSCSDMLWSRVGVTFDPSVKGGEGWFRDGRLHRDDGPAVSRPDGLMVWFMDGVRHRVGGPAVVYPDGSTERWVQGVKVVDPSRG